MEMTTETKLSYNAEGSEFAASPATVYELIARIESIVEAGRMRGTGRSMLKSSETLGIVEDLKSEMPKIMSLSDQILLKKDQTISEAEHFAQASRENVMRETEEMRRRAEDERNIIISQAQSQARELIEKSSVVKASREEAERIVEEAKNDAEKIMVRAKREANTIVDAADERSYRQIMETDEYSKKLMMKLEERLAQQIMQIRQGIDAVNESMEERERQHSRISIGFNASRP